MKWLKLCLLLFVFCLGYGLAWWHSGGTKEAEVVSQVSGRPALVSTLQSGDGSAPDEWKPVSLAELLSVGGEWERVQQMNAYVNRAPVSVLSDLAWEAVEQIEEPFVDDFLRLVLAKWGSVDEAAVLEFGVSLQDHEKIEEMKVFFEMIGNWADSDFERVWAFAEALPDDAKIAVSLRYNSLKSMAQDDPIGALQRYRDYVAAGGKELQGLERTIFAELAAVDLDYAKAELSRAQKPERSEIAAGILAHFADEDPRAGLSFALSLPAGTLAEHEIHHPLLHKWMMRSPDEALSAVMELEGAHIQSNLISMMISSWSYRDLDAAMDWVLPRIDEPLVSSSWNSLVYTLARSDPERGLEIIASNPALKDSQRGLIGAWFQVDHEAALAWIQDNLNNTEQAEILGSSLYSIARSNPQAARDIVDMMPMGQSRDRALSYVASQSARADTEGTLQWLAGQAEDSARMNALAMVFSDLAEVDPVRAAEYSLAWETTNDLERQRLVSQVASGWAKTDPLAALEWLGSLDSELSNSSKQGLIHSWGSHDFDAAADYVLSLPEGEERSDHLGTLVVTSVQSDPDATIEWMASLPEAEQTDSLTMGLVSAWARNDPIGASEWINELPRNRQRDVAATELVSQISRSAPKDALPWALDIEDSALRNRALGNVASGGRNLDRATVAAAIEAMSYPDEKKEWYRKNYLN